MKGKRGLDVLRDESLSRSIAFGRRERDRLGLTGLRPHRVATPAQLVDRVRLNLERLPRDLDRYMLLSSIQERNERLFVVKHFSRVRARTETRRPRALRQFEIYIGLLESAEVPGSDGIYRPLGDKSLKAVIRADLDAAFTARLHAIEAARHAAYASCVDPDNSNDGARFLEICADSESAPLYFVARYGRRWPMKSRYAQAIG